MSLHSNRNLKPVKYIESDKSSSDAENHDPFKVSSDEDDEDFQPPPPPPKKARPEPSKSKKAIKTKRLTVKQRLNRLSQKFQKNGSSTTIVPIVNLSANASSTIQTDFVTKKSKSIDNKEKSLSIQPGPSFGAYDNYFDTVDVKVNITETEPSKNQMTEEIQSREPENALLNLFSGLKDQLDDVMANVVLLRKQVSRLELKGLGVPVVGHSEPNMNIDQEIILDLDAAFTKEGLPISLCVELNQFEGKLRQDNQFKEKMVRFYIFFVRDDFIYDIILTSISTDIIVECNTWA